LIILGQQKILVRKHESSFPIKTFGMISEENNVLEIILKFDANGLITAVLRRKDEPFDGGLYEKESLERPPRGGGCVWSRSRKVWKKAKSQAMYSA